MLQIVNIIAASTFITIIGSTISLAQSYPYDPTYPLGPAQGGPPYGAAFDYGAQAGNERIQREQLQQELHRLRQERQDHVY